MLSSPARSLADWWHSPDRLTGAAQAAEGLQTESPRDGFVGGAPRPPGIVGFCLHPSVAAPVLLQTSRVDYRGFVRHVRLLNIVCIVPHHQVVDIAPVRPYPVPQEAGPRNIIPGTFLRTYACIQHAGRNLLRHYYQYKIASRTSVVRRHISPEYRALPQAGAEMGPAARDTFSAGQPVKSPSWLQSRAAANKSFGNRAGSLSASKRPDRTIRLANLPAETAEHLRVRRLPSQLQRTSHEVST